MLMYSNALLLSLVLLDDPADTAQQQRPPPAGDMAPRRGWLVTSTSTEKNKKELR